MDHRLVRRAARGGCDEAVLYPAEPARWTFIMEVMKTEVPHNAASAGTVRAVHITEG
jgi:hypothetical protein